MARRKRSLASRYPKVLTLGLIPDAPNRITRNEFPAWLVAKGVSLLGTPRFQPWVSSPPRPTESLAWHALVPAAFARRRIREQRVVRQVQQMHAARRPIPLLGHDNLRLAPQILIIAVVILLAMDKRHHVRILLNRASLAQIAQQRLLVARPLLASARQLAQRHH